MEIRPQVIREDAMKTLAGVNRTVDALKERADAENIPVERMCDVNGQLMLAPLLHSKALLLNTLALLHKPTISPRR
jgi:hypothetical protein